MAEEKKLIIDDILGVNEDGEIITPNPESMDDPSLPSLEDLMVSPDEEPVSAVEEQPHEEIAEKKEESKEEPVEEEKIDVPDPVVPADAEPEEAAHQMPAEQPRTRAPRRQARPAQKPAAPREIGEMGVKSDEIIEKESLEKTEEEKELATFRLLNSLARNKDIAWGEIYGVEPIDALSGSIGSRFAVALIFNGAKILIPEKEYFEPTYDFGSDYFTLSESMKANRRNAAAKYQIGARIPFTVAAAGKREITEGEFEGENAIFAVGSRREAMRILRDMFFVHKDHPETPSRTVKVGYLAWANVVGVREDYVVVECLGVETRIDAYNLNNEYVENCNDFVKPGDRLKVRVRKVYVNDDDVYLTVSGRLNDASKAINDIKLRGTYLGVVDHYNKSNNFYTISLKNGVSASVRADQVQGEVELTNGDNVSVLVTRIMPTYVIGMARKL